MPIEHVWWWMPRADNPHSRYGDASGLIVGKITSAVTKTDVNIEVTHSVHPSFPVGAKCRRCRMKTRDAVIVEGVPTDAQTKKEIMPSQPKSNDVPAEGNEDATLGEQYNVVKVIEGNLHKKVKGYFVLMPEKDPAALQALRSYAALCKSPGTKAALFEWIKRIERDIVPLWQKGEHLGSMGRINAGIDKLV